MSRVALLTPTTAGIPYSRAMVVPCEIIPPVSVTSAAAVRNSGVQPGSVVEATRISPGSTCASLGSNTTRATPVTRPAAAARPVRLEPDADPAALTSGAVPSDNRIEGTRGRRRSRS